MASQAKLGSNELLYRCAQTMGLRPAWLKPGGVFVVNIAGKEQYIHGACSPLNSQANAAMAKNKYLTRLILQRNNLPNIPFARPRDHGVAQAFLNKHGKIIAKPVKGSGAQDINIVTNSMQLQALDITHYILEKYIAGQEMRYLVLNGSVVAVHESRYGTSVAADRPLERISYSQQDWDTELVETSLRTADTLGLRFAAIDYLTDATGRSYVLEVNTKPGLKWFHAPTSGPVIDVAHLFLESLLNEHLREVSATHSTDLATDALSFPLFSAG